MAFVKSETFIKVILIYRILSGYYWKISSNKLVSVLLRIYCLFIATAFLCSMYQFYLFVSIPGKIHMCCICYLFSINVATNLIFNGDNFVYFLQEIRNVNIPRHIGCGDKIPITTVLIILTIFLRIGSRIQFDDHTHIDIMQGVFSIQNFSLTFDFLYYSSYLTRIMMFELLWQRITMLRKCLEQDLSIARRFEDGEQLLRNNLRACLKIFRSLVNTTRVCDAPMKLLVRDSVLY
ncbi:hypothetical protein B5X24_HaOG200900 [Helicoverpa armigera]|nr:hypothetical protein B5X24_HaOG200900 [Helicoverpa armigera]